MNVEQITMPKDQALALLRSYRAGLYRSHEAKARAEYEAVVRGYRALARGTPIISLTASMRRAGVDHLHRPRLAVARADVRVVHYYVRVGEPRFTYGESSVWETCRTRCFMLPEGTFPSAVPKDLVELRYRALVPLIPPHLVPARPRLDKLFILWEATWEQVPPADPMLLRHLHGDLYAVLAAWDLTEVERAVISGRRA